jgi:hypothetical protein
MLFWSNHTCGNIMIFMSLNPIVSLLLWGLVVQDTIGSYNYCPTETILQGNISYNKIPSQSIEKVNGRTLKPLQPWTKTFLSSRSRLQKRKKIFFLHLRRCLHTAQSIQDTTGWLNRFNPARNRFVIAFHKPSMTTSPTRHGTHQDSDSTNAFSPGHSIQWIPLIPKEGGLISMDISGHPLLPTDSHTFFPFLQFFVVFRVPKFLAHFSGPKRHFFVLLGGLDVAIITP